VGGSIPGGYAGHPGLRWLRAQEAGREWLAALPALVRECAEKWSLRLGEPFPYAYASLALPATRPDGTPAVLKLQFPDRESTHEGAALAHWAGAGAIRLIAADPARHALLLERCVPGTSLSAVGGDAAMDVLVGLLPRLLVPAGAPFEPFEPVAAQANDWAWHLPRSWARAGRPFPRRLVDRAVDLCRTLAASQGPLMLVNQDLHGDNVLRAQREPWLVIDPKPVLAEREFAVAPVVRSAELGHSRDLVRRRLDRLVDELGLDRERARGWTIAQTLGWAFEDGEVLPAALEVVEWLI
jgi:streptomycin 6-kinase